MREATNDSLAEVGDDAVDTMYDNEHVVVRQQGTVPIVSHVPAFAWRCQVCGWLGVGHTGANAALKEASDHMWDEHNVAMCKSIGGKRLYGHPGHRWKYVQGTDSTDQCERCHEWCGK